MNSISLLISITIPFISILISFLAYTLELSQIYAQALMLFYILGVLAGIIFRDNQRNRVVIDRKFVYFISSIIVAIAIILIAYFILIKPEVKIEYPRNGDVITDGRTKVSGIAKNLAKQTKVWIVVYYVGRKVFYPQIEVIVNKEGKWEGEVILAAGNTDYFIWVLTTNETQNKWIKENSEFREWKYTPTYFDKVKVTRPATY